MFRIGVTTYHHLVKEKSGKQVALVGRSGTLKVSILRNAERFAQSAPPLPKISQLNPHTDHLSE